MKYKYTKPTTGKCFISDTELDRSVYCTSDNEDPCSWITEVILEKEDYDSIIARLEALEGSN